MKLGIQANARKEKSALKHKNLRQGASMYMKGLEKRRMEKVKRERMEAQGPQHIHIHTYSTAAQAASLPNDYKVT
jgi:hypothetical protein